MAAEQAPDKVPPPSDKPESAPDPDEDDLSDLDDMLDDFSAAKPEATKATEDTKVAEQGTATESTKDDEIDEADLEKQLQAGMAELLGAFGSDPKMQSEVENMMKELSGGLGGMNISPEATAGSSTAKAKPTGAGSKPKKSGEDAFQDTIRKTMERMQNSGDSASAAAASSGEDDILAQMMKAMEKGEFPGMDGGNEEDFNKMLTTMMEQLTNKDILYEPMKDLYDKFPAWLEANKDSTPAEDLARYKSQHSLVTEIVKKFEEPSYSDSNQQDRDLIVDRMQKMQVAGSPPPDLVGDLGSAQDMLQDLDGGSCPQQ